MLRAGSTRRWGWPFGVGALYIALARRNRVVVVNGECHQVEYRTMRHCWIGDLALVRCIFAVGGDNVSSYYRDIAGDLCGRQ
jgi:hypothetical protein